jgi:hypothetical protein
MFGREINHDVVRQAVAEFLERWLEGPGNRAEFLTAIAQAVSHATVDTQEKWLDRHSDILLDELARRIGDKVKVTTQVKLPVP